jgi:pantoate--beta-alanine ligase
MRAASQGRVGLVPTMGALHDGHLTLMREARKECDLLVCSLFVNPTQFGPNEDFGKYPRDETRDSEMASSVGVDVLFAPNVDEVYGGNTTSVLVKGVSDLWEGALRPGHFDGVATVVCKLFNMVGANVAYFGLKDLQQCAVVRRIVHDLNMRIELRFSDTVRESDGLAMSSRNAYLSSEDRSRAPLIYQTLSKCFDALRQAKSPQETLQILHAGKTILEDEEFAVDYFALVDSNTMEPKDIPGTGDSIIVAARLGKTRLIDNIQLVY